MKSTGKVWALRFLLVFGLFHLYRPPLSSNKQADDPGEISTLTITHRLDRLQLPGVLLRDEGNGVTQCVGHC